MKEIGILVHPQNQVLNQWFLGSKFSLKSVFVLLISAENLLYCYDIVVM